jgi:hypothetical protein
MTEKERKKEMRERRKQEKKLRGTGSAEELGELIGRKHKAKVRILSTIHRSQT